ncbi:hypothetical protein FGG08_000691 [Glutinoglossum americanum]|uniref:Protein Zds1 C-terminal domain-containing protein n=1 Tax=Glutinoglossum americanum TaxID=1670608 RepID=A0A9P8I9T3_9PEZI|nr:hypothetical protein FGG08_000691 [Glutinoglossum americanum]
MQTSSRTRDFGGLPPTKRTHVPQLSISDDNHHVTEAIGDMYGNMDFDSRPLSVAGSPLSDHHRQNVNSHHEIQKASAPRAPLSQTLSNERVPPNANGQGKTNPNRNSSFGHGHENGPLSPTLSGLRSPASSAGSDTANSQFPLNDIDYESDPAAVAQELSNLQALRRMSMDVNAAGDPDLPSFNNASFIPTRAPTHADDEDAASRLYWVPARLHPELAPKEFKTFVETRVKQIRRRSGDDGSLSPKTPNREGSSGGLRRKKSMLSKQIDNSGGRAAEGYKDGAERLERKRSQTGQRGPTLKVSDFQELDELVKDPAKLIGKLSLDTSQAGLEAGHKVTGGEDMPILPAAPPGNSLRRSTRTTYRRGSLRKGERVPYSKRAPRVAQETDTDDSPVSSPVAPHNFTLSRVQTEPIPASPAIQDQIERPSRPARPGRGDRLSLEASSSTSFNSILDQPTPSEPESEAVPQLKSPPSPPSKRPAKSKPLISEPLHVPRIIETPPPPEDGGDETPPQQLFLPTRTSSHEPPPSSPPQVPLPHGPPGASPTRSSKRPSLGREAQPPRNINQTLNDIASQPSPLPGNNARTDNLSVVPTFSDDKKPDKKRKEKDRDSNEHSGGKKSGWGWLLGSEEKEKDKDGHKDASKKSKLKGIKAAEKPHDNTRLDLLQASIDGGRGRESLVMDRDSIRLEEERKKESIRKSSSGESKKEKESGIFSFFGGGKKKSDRDGTGKKSNSLRAHSPEPPPRVRRPDIDYNWTRFSILEERAIYRMAHIKLANPRRALYSQVLLSNFMYSYLAKVQQMHPQIQVPQSAAQKNLRLQQQQQDKQQSELKAQAGAAQAYQEQQQRQEENQYYQYHDQSEGAPYVDDSQIFDYEHGQDSDDPNRPKSRTSQYSTENGNAHHHLQPKTQRDFQYQSQFEESGQSRDEMW